MPITVTQHKSGHSTASATTVTVTTTSTGSGKLLVVAACNAGTRTVAASGVTDNIGNTYTQATNAAANANSSVDNSDIWYCLSATSGVTTITITFTGSAGTFVKDAEAWEVSGFTSAAFDLAGHTNDNADGGDNVTDGTSVTTTSTTGFIVGAIKVPAGSVVDVNPNTGNEFTSGGDIASGTDSAFCSFISSTAAAHKPQWHHGNSFINSATSTAAFKEAGADTLFGQACL